MPLSELGFLDVSHVYPIIACANIAMSQYSDPYRYSVSESNITHFLHYQVALRRKKDGHRVSPSDTVPYIICIEKVSI